MGVLEEMSEGWGRGKTRLLSGPTSGARKEVMNNGSFEGHNLKFMRAHIKTYSAEMSQVEGSSPIFLIGKGID